MLYPRVRIILVWRRDGDSKPKACYWLHSGTISDVAAAQTYVATEINDGDGAVYTFDMSVSIKDAFQLAKDGYVSARSVLS